MRLAVISDVHANAAALARVLDDATRLRVDRIVCLGDLVGYNSQPAETLRLLRSHGVDSVCGNHDLMAIGALEPDRCGPNARAAMAWTRRVLSDDERRTLAALPFQTRPAPGVLCVHSALADTEVRLTQLGHFAAEYHRIRAHDASIRVCFTGHTHVTQVVCVTASGAVYPERAVSRIVRADTFHFINPGSVGHPRESDYRATYCVFDTERGALTYRRVAYPRRAMQARNALHGIHTDLGPSVATFVLRRLRSSAIATLRGAAG